MKREECGRLLEGGKMQKLGFKNRIKVLMTGELSDLNRAFLGGDDVDNGSVGDETAMKYSAVSACIRVRAETFAGVPAILYKKTKDGREANNDLLIGDILHTSPNEEMSAFNFKEAVMTNFDLSGNAVCEKIVNGAGDILGLYPYKHSQVEIKRSETTRKLEYIITQGNNKKVLRRDQVLHVPNLSYDGIIGLSPIHYAASAIRLGLSYEKFGVNFYKNAAMPSGVFKNPNALSDTSFARLKNDLTKNYTGLKNTGTPMLLEEGLEWSPMSTTPVDAQLIESKYFQIEDICRIYRVPQHMVGKLDRSTFNNIEHQALEFVMYTILPICKRFEDNINMQLLTLKQREAGYYIEFKLDGLLRGDQKSRAEAYATGRQWGWLSVNDIRKLENMPPIPNGDIYIQPLNFTEAGKVDQNVQANAKLVEDIQKMIGERR